MTNRKKPVLGRNLSSMLSQSTLQHVQESAADELRSLPLDAIRPGRYQPRSVFDKEKLAELADSIRAQGVVQPVVVRPLEDDGFELIAGERRWRAAQMAGIEHIPAVVRDVPDEVSVAMALIENIQREDLNPLEEATALRRLIDDFRMTHQEAADAFGRSRAAASNLLRLLELMEEVKEMIDLRLIEMGHARALLSLDDELQVQAAREVMHRQLSVRETENLVRRLQQSKKKIGHRQRMDPDILRLQNQLAQALGARVQIQHRASGKGRLIISYNSVDEFDGILERLDLAE
jgi:ParB family chromosome partitioning protein